MSCPVKVDNLRFSTGLVRKGDRMIVGVSGGPDSTALLLLLNSLRRKYCLKLFAAHVNYKLRGRESDADEKYVRNLAERLDIPVSVKRVSLKKLETGNLQDIARKIRMDFFSGVAGKHKAGKVALGHNADDQAETVLMRLFRGSGPAGISGISAKRRLSGRIQVIHPLRECSRSEILSYLKQQCVRARTDSSNLVPKYQRNRIRLELLPWLRKNINPAISSTLCRTAEILDSDEKYFAGKVGILAGKMLRRTENGFKISMKLLRTLPQALQFRLLRLAVEKIKGNSAGIMNLYSFLREKGKTVSLPGRITVNLAGKDLVVEKERERQAGKKKQILKIPGKTRVSGTKIILLSELHKKNKNSRNHSPAIAYFDLEKIRMPLIVRNRRPGDRFRPLGMQGTKKIHDFLIDEKVPEKERDNIPLLADADGKIIWVVGKRISDEAKITGDTHEILVVQARKQ